MKKQILLRQARRVKRAGMKAKNAKDNYNKSICFFRKTNQHFYVSFLYENFATYIVVSTFLYKKAQNSVRKSSLLPQMAKDFYTKIIAAHPDIQLANIYFNKRSYTYSGNVQIFCETFSACFDKAI